jgi:hypothetical protein
MLGKGMREHKMPSRAEPGGFNKRQARIRLRGSPPLRPSHRDATQSRVSVGALNGRELDPGPMVRLSSGWPNSAGNWNYRSVFRSVAARCCLKRLNVNLG